MWLLSLSCRLMVTNGCPTSSMVSASQAGCRGKGRGDWLCPKTNQIMKSSFLKGWLRDFSQSHWPSTAPLPLMPSDMGEADTCIRVYSSHCLSKQSRALSKESEEWTWAGQPAVSAPLHPQAAPEDSCCTHMVSCSAFLLPSEAALYTSALPQALRSTPPPNPTSLVDPLLTGTCQPSGKSPHV